MTKQSPEDRIKELEAELARRDARDQAMRIWLENMPGSLSGPARDPVLPFGVQDLGVRELDWQGKDGHFQVRHPIGFSCEVTEIAAARWFCHVQRLGVNESLGEFDSCASAQRAAQNEFSRIVRTGLAVGAIPAEITSLRGQLDEMASAKTHAEQMFHGWREEARKADTKLQAITDIALTALERSTAATDLKANAGFIGTAIENIRKAVRGPAPVRPVDPGIISDDLVNAMARALRLAEHDQIDFLQVCESHAKRVASDPQLADLRAHRARAVADRLSMTRDVLRQLNTRPESAASPEGPTA